MPTAEQHHPDRPLASLSDAEFERHKWQTEAGFREREIEIKERESQPSVFKSTVFASVMAGVLGLLVHAGTDSYTSWRQNRDEADRQTKALDEEARRQKLALREESRHQQATLIQKALEHEDPLRVLAKLKLLNELKLIPDYQKDVQALLDDADSAQRLAFVDTGRQYQAALIEKAVSNDDLSRIISKLKLLDDADLIPDYVKASKIREILRGYRTVAAESASIPTTSTPRTSTNGAPSTPVVPSQERADASVVATVDSSLAAPASCANAKADRAIPTGWLFLGSMRDAKSAWVPSDSGTRSVRFDSPEPAGPGADLVNRLKGACLHTVVAKYLREDGPPGQKVQSAVKRTLRSGVRLRIVEVDDVGIDQATEGKYAVIWAKVEAISD